jgi:virginiamycin B lyase
MNPGRALVVAALGIATLGRGAGGVTIVEYVVPTRLGTPFGIVGGADGALWFTEAFGNKIGRIATDGAITEYPVPTAKSFPSGIAAGPDGALWFTESGGNKIGRIATGGAFTEYAIATAASGPSGITTGPRSGSPSGRETGWGGSRPRERSPRSRCPRGRSGLSRETSAACGAL